MLHFGFVEQFRLLDLPAQRRVNQFFLQGCVDLQFRAGLLHQLFEGFGVFLFSQLFTVAERALHAPVVLLEHLDDLVLCFGTVSACHLHLLWCCGAGDAVRHA